MVKHLKRFIPGALMLSLLSSGGALAQASYDTVWDTFSAGLQMNTTTPKWTYLATPSFVANDAITAPLSNGLYIKSPGVNPQTGLPAFTLTVPQEAPTGGNPGGMDHVKWLLLMNHTASTGVAGFDAVPSQEFSCSTRIIGQTFGTRFHPFGSKAAANDYRLASFMMAMVDMESGMIFDFAFTNKRIYAVYERMGFGRTQTNNYAAFTFVVPVASRSTGTAHDVKIAYDRSGGFVRWILNGKEVYRVSTLGRRINRRYMVLDHGGVEQTVVPRQFNCGMGMTTLLDASDGQQPGLVRLSNAPNNYFMPSKGEPSLQTFVDELSQPGSRLFGQGVEFRVTPFRVSSMGATAPAPAPEPLPVEELPGDKYDTGDGFPTYEPIP